jgi:large subunit ribosomal protein L7/L12
MTDEKTKAEELKNSEVSTDKGEIKEKVAEVKEEAVEAPTEVAKEEKKEEKTAPNGKHADLIKQVETMSVLELSELVKALEDRFGVSAAAPAMMMAAGPAAAGEAVEEKTSFTVMLTSAGDQKIAAIKAVREIRPDLGLVDAKTLVESAPKEVLKDAKKEDAEVAKAKLEAAGAKVELK